MKTLNVTGYVGVLLAGFAAVAAGACDDGGSSTDGAGGDDDSTTTVTSTGPGSGGGSGTGGGAPVSASVIDNMEDGDGSIHNDAGRVGAWYTYNDATATGTQTPVVMAPFTMTAISPPRDGSGFAASTKGSGFDTWGAGFGFDLNNSGGTTAKKSPYDASKYTGVSFWAKIGAGSVGAIRFNIGDKNTSPDGGVCATGKCDDDFGKNLTLTESWQKFDITFAEMKQVGWSMVALKSIETTALYSVHFQAGAKAKFEIWVDDIAFTQ
jgi:hypothetical protein